MCDSETEVQIMTGIPDDKIAQFVSIVKMDPKYVSHEVVPEGNGRSTLKVTVRKN